MPAKAGTSCGWVRVIRSGFRRWMGYGAAVTATFFMRGLMLALGLVVLLAAATTTIPFVLYIAMATS